MKYSTLLLLVGLAFTPSYSATSPQGGTTPQENQPLEVTGTTTLSNHFVVSLEAEGTKVDVWIPHCGNPIPTHWVPHCQPSGRLTVVTKHGFYEFSQTFLSDLAAGTISYEDQQMRTSTELDPAVQDACERLDAGNELSNIGAAAAGAGLLACAETAGVGCLFSLVGVAVAAMGDSLTDDAMDDLECCIQFAIGCDTDDFLANSTPADCPFGTHVHIGSPYCWCNGSEVPLDEEGCPDHCQFYCVGGEPVDPHCFCDMNGCEVCVDP